VSYRFARQTSALSVPPPPPTFLPSCLTFWIVFRLPLLSPSLSMGCVCVCVCVRVMV